MTSDQEPPPPPPPAPKLTWRQKAQRVLQPLGLDHFHRVVALLLATATLVLAIVTYLEVEAHSKAESAGVEAQLKQIDAATTEITGRSQAKFDWDSAYRTWTELDFRAESAQQAKDNASMNRYLDLRDKIRDESELLRDYFPDIKDVPGTSGSPELGRYEVDKYYRKLQVLNEESEAQNEVKEFWHRRQSGFLTALAFLSSALFVMGLALTTPRRLARVLVVAGALAITGASLYVIKARIGPEPHVEEEAIAAFADGKSQVYQAETDEQYDKAIDFYSEAVKADPHYINALVARADAHVDIGIRLLAKEQSKAEEHFHNAISDFEKARGLGHDDPTALWNVGWVYYLIGDYDHAIAIDQEAVRKDPSLFAVRHNLGLAYLVRGHEADSAHGKKSDLDLALEAFAESRAEAVHQLTPADGAAPSSSWSTLEDLALDFENLSLRLDGKTYSWIEAPAVDAIANPSLVKEQATKLREQVQNLVAALEAGDVPAGGTVSPRTEAGKREVSKIEISGYALDENRLPLATKTGPKLDAGTADIDVEVTYSGMEGAKRVSWRLYHNGRQDRLRGRNQPWNLGPSGVMTIPMKYSYSSIWHFSPGYYVVEIYVDNVQVGRQSFTIGDY